MRLTPSKETETNVPDTRITEKNTQIPKKNQYQTFPGQAGSSNSLDKLLALRLPPLAGKSFLDVGCNEGFFCGFALHEGASKVVGMDNHRLSVDEAARRFPDGTFLKQSWDDPIEGQFDVILLASALHYAQDQTALIHKLMDHLTPQGTLVLELGMSSEPGNKWVTVKRSIDERQFPSRAKLGEILDPFAWKLMGNSVNQAGDPTPRVVVHIQPRLPYAFLLMTPSGYGKSTITRLLGTAKGLKSISGDALMHQISLGKHQVSDGFKSLIEKDYVHTNIGPVVDSLFQQGLGSEWVSLWLAQAAHQDVIIDAYIPRTYWDEVTDVVKEHGYAPIQLAWERIGPTLHDRASYSDRAKSYVKSLKVPLATRVISSLTGNNKRNERLTLLPEDFEPSRYLELHPDVATAGMDPAYHYLNHGYQEGRRYK